MRYALLIYENPQALASRENGDEDTYLGAWRAYHLCTYPRPAPRFG